MDNIKNEKSPITGEMDVLIDKDPATGLISKMCSATGYVTNSFLKLGSKTVDDIQNQLPKIVANNLFRDIENGQLWLLFMQSHKYASLHPIPDESGESDYLWQIALIKELDEEERKNYPILEKPGEFYDSYIDFDNGEIYQQNEFPLAFSRFYELSLEEVL